MPTKRYFSYVRVSTAKQGQQGTSLAEQLAAIERYAGRWNIEIIRQYEEKETAAKQGRPVFLEMLKALRQGKADGVIIHKIDRSARNLKDWADLGALIDSGIEVHFANESIDLHSRGGRLSADIQAVVAADFIRNLREEVRKGFYGRLKQGLYPMPAPIGYVDVGPGKPKEPHPLYAPLVKKAFELYATGKHGIISLFEKMNQLGLRTIKGGRVSRNAFNHLLKNPFYAGLIKINKTGEVYCGKHQPIISQELFNRAQAVMSGKSNDKKNRHFFIFSRLVICAGCKLKLIPEHQKGNVYYRCQTSDCPQKTLREEIIEERFGQVLEELRFSDHENDFLKKIIENQKSEIDSLRQAREQSLRLQLKQCQERLSKLTDALIDGTIEQELFVPKKNSLVIEEQRLQQELTRSDQKSGDALDRIKEILELANRAYSSYKQAIAEEKREMVKILTSNFSVAGKTVLIKLNYVFEVIANRYKNADGEPHRDVPRTLSTMMAEITKHCTEHDSDT